MKIATPFSAHNTDGIDPSGTNVTVNLSSISDGDDDFAINASSAGSNMTVENTNTYSGHGISIGSYTQGGFTNLLVNNVNMAGTASDTNATGIRLKSSEDRGGLVKTITYENMCLKDIHHILQFTPFYNTNAGTLYPSFQNVVLSNVHFLTPTTNQYPYLVQMEGFSANYISTITLQNVVFDSLLATNVTPTSQDDTFALSGNVYPAFLQALPGTGVTYTGSATATAGAGVSSCTGVFPYVTGELYLTTATATSLKAATISANASVTLSAMVQPAMSQVAFSGTAGSSPAAAALTQPVSFYEGTTLKGTGTIGGNGTIASLTLSGLTAGPHTYTAQYPGDSNYSALTFGSVTVTVTGATVATTTTLTAPTTGTYGASTTLSVMVTGTGGTPSGTVGFYDGTTHLGDGTLVSGSATLTYTFTGGTHSLTAVYGGDTTFVTSTSTASTLKISTANSATAVAANPTTVSQGQTTVLTATVTGVAGGATPTGTVSFTDGATTLGSGSLNSSGVATATATMNTSGPRTVLASYGGDGNYAVSSNTVGVTVTQSTTTTTLTVPSTAVYGVAQTLSAKVTATTGTPTGSITFYDGTTALGSGMMTSGSASLPGQVLLGGAHSITAAYSGDSTYPSSTSTASVLTVTVAGSSTSLTVAPSTAQAMALVSLTATVNGVSSGVTPTGTVTFSDGTNTLGTGTLSGNVATLAVGLPALGARTITASYGGDTNYGVSSGNASAMVTAIPTTTSVALSTPSTYGGATVTFTATVASANTGIVTFLVGGTAVGTGTVSASGVATYLYTVPTTVVGTYLVTASYAAAGVYAASATATAQSLGVSSAFQLTSSANAVAIAAGSSGTVTLSLLPGGGFTGAVALGCSSPVSYVTCSVASSSVSLSGTSATPVIATINVASTISMLGFRDGIWLAMMTPFAMLAVGLRKRKRLQQLCAMLVLAFMAAAVSGCGGSSGGTTTTSNKPTGTQIVTFTAAAAGVTQSVQVAVNIQ